MFFYITPAPNFQEKDKGDQQEQDAQKDLSKEFSLLLHISTTFKNPVSSRCSRGIPCRAEKF
jgi:hypothetical protein